MDTDTTHSVCLTTMGRPGRVTAVPRGIRSISNYYPPSRLEAADLVISNPLSRNHPPTRTGPLGPVRSGRSYFSIQALSKKTELRSVPSMPCTFGLQAMNSSTVDQMMNGSLA
jgi:hypothetical protein